jgi:2-oxopent-4-enoate/cis-2-oxohex-4-enoate hydratase
MTIPVQTAVERVIEAHARRRPVPPLSETHGDFPLAHAYAIQDALRAELARRGQRSIGWKLGATSPLGQAVMGVKEPACGFLMPRQYGDGAEVSAAEFVALGVEAEVAFRMRARLAGPGVTAATALPAVEGAVAALELPDFIFSGTPVVADFVACSVIARAIVLGGRPMPLPAFDVSGEEVVYEHNGEVVGTYTTAEVMGSPLNALAWLANHLAGRGLALEPGDVVMSGSISKVLRPAAGDTVRARFAHLGSVSVRVAP